MPKQALLICFLTNRLHVSYTAISLAVKHRHTPTYSFRPRVIHRFLWSSELTELAGLEIVHRDIVAIKCITRFIVIITNSDKDRSASDKVRILYSLQEGPVFAV